MLGAVCLAFGVRPQVLEVGRSGANIWVRDGELVRLQYTQSMYAVPVEERFRVEGGRLVLFEVVSSDAALEYLGIETKGAGNAKNIVQEFFVPAHSVGGYRLSASGDTAPLEQASLVFNYLTSEVPSGQEDWLNIYYLASSMSITDFCLCLLTETIFQFIFRVLITGQGSRHTLSRGFQQHAQHPTRFSETWCST